MRPIDYGRWVLWIASGLVLLFLIFPIFIVVPLSFSSSPYLQFPPPGYSTQWYLKYLGRSDWLTSTLRSFNIAFLTMVLATLLSTCAAFALVRGSLRAKRLITVLILSPLIVPGIVVAIALYFFYARLTLVDTVLAVVLSHTAHAVPYAVIVVMASLRGFDRRLEQAAMNLGAGPWRTFRYVTLPIIWPGVFAAGILAFIASFDELIISIFLTSVRAVTLPVRMWNAVIEEMDPTIAAVSVLMVFVSLAAMGSAALLTRRAKQS